MTNIWEALVLGLIQGVTEFIPISSDGHLAAAKLIMGIDPSDLFSLDMFLHSATLLAMLIVFRRGFLRLFTGMLRAGPERNELKMVLIGAIPAGIVGLLLRDWIGDLPERCRYVIPICWTASGIALLTLRNRPEPVPPARITWKVALWIGLWQILALLPGLSRSGITISAALWAKCGRSESAEYSFLMASPLIFGVNCLAVKELLSGKGVSISPAVLISSWSVAFLSGWAALYYLIRHVKSGKIHRWGYYLLAVSLAFTAYTALSLS